MLALFPTDRADSYAPFPGPVQLSTVEGKWAGLGIKALHFRGFHDSLRSSGDEATQLAQQVRFWKLKWGNL